VSGVSGVLIYAGSNRTKDLAKAANMAKKQYRQNHGQEATHISLPASFNWTKAKFAGLIVEDHMHQPGYVVVGHRLKYPAFSKEAIEESERQRLIKQGVIKKDG
jgi:hypothetical protein